MRSSVDSRYEENVADANALRAMLEAIDGCPAPVVARVQGHALGGGAGLVAAADIAIAAPDAVFAFSEVKLGIIPAVISPFALAKIGPGAARRYFVTGERFDAETALRIGLVHEVADDLDAAVDRMVGELLSRGTAGGALGEAARARAARRPRDRALDRRAANERRGTGGPARLPREAQGELARVSVLSAEREHRVSNVELFFDLVFVFAFTQVTTLWLDEPTWGGLGRGLLVLAALWWIWAGCAWLTNSADAESGSCLQRCCR